MHFQSLVLPILALSSVAVSLSHLRAHHHAVAQRRQDTDALPVAAPVVKRSRPKKRGVQKAGRCKAPSSASSSVVQSTATPLPSVAVPDNVEAGNTPAPPTTTTQPPTTSWSQPSSTPSPSNSAAPPANSGSGSNNTHSGDGTWYSTGLTACGITNKDTDMIAAVSHYLYDYQNIVTPNSNNNPVCNQWVTASYTNNGVTKTVRVQITDKCEGCDIWSLDFSIAAFSQLADLGVGRLYGVTWSFDDPTFATLTDGATPAEGQGD